MWEIEPVEIKVSIKDKKPPERIAETEVCKIGVDPCYIIVRQEGVFGESFREFLHFNNTLHRVENTLSMTCEICGRLVVGKNNFPYEVSSNTKEGMHNFCDSCIEKYKGWDNYIESELLFGTGSCEDCGKLTSKVLTGKKIKVQVCEECINELIDMGFEKTIDATSHKSALPFPIRLKGKSVNKQIHKLKLTKYLTPYTTTELPPAAQKNVFDEPIEQPRKIPQSLIKQKIEKKEKIKIKEKQIIKIWLIILGIFILLTFIGVDLIDYNSQKELSELRDKIKQEQISPKSTQEQPTTNLQEKQLYSLEDSINFLLKKFPEVILDVRDDGASVYIKLKDSFWYNLTSSQRQRLADRLLDGIYASGDVKKILYIQDEHSRVVAEQHLEKVGPGLILQPYMDLK